MDNRKFVPATGEKRGKRGLAAKLGLLAAVIVVERLAPSETARTSVVAPARRETLPTEEVPTNTDRGRLATSPAEIPAKGWKDILLRVYNNFGQHRILSLAAGMTYYTLLAIFPAIAAMVAIYGVFADPSTIAKHLDQAAGFLPSGALDVAREQLTRVASKGGQTLGLTFLIGLAVSLWSANAAMKSMFDTLNIVHGEEEKRSFFRLNAVSLSFTVAAIAFVLVALGAIVVIPVVLNYLWLSSLTDLLVRLAPWPAMFLVVALALAVVYRYGPSRAVARWRWITWGSVIATILWIVASVLFSWYAANFGGFNETYGSLGAVVGLLTWLWISAIVILLGAELDAAMEHQTEPDLKVSKPGTQVTDTATSAKH